MRQLNEDEEYHMMEEAEEQYHEHEFAERIKYAHLPEEEKAKLPNWLQTWLKQNEKYIQ